MMQSCWVPGWRWATVFAFLTCFGASGCNPRSGEDSASAEEAPESKPYRNIIGTEANVYSQHGEELIIRDFFQDRRDGFFLDVGCAWPVHYSNTYYLEKELGWSGIGVDAIDDHARRWRNRRPNSKFVNFIVTDHSGGVESFYRTERGELLGIATLTPGAGLGKEEKWVEIQVPTITLTDLLDQNGVSKLDLLSMDIEGAELLALAGFDIHRFEPELVVIEVHAAAREPIQEFFSAHGYERIERYDLYDEYNYYFTPKRRRLPDE
jgi:FkbM family methyltransferase